jgi:hypothetical protein
MQFHIREIILWPKKALPPRRLPFKPGQLNIISGVSRTGKSAIIPIIDYCLGSETCQIPVQTIRDATAWFGILVETSEGQQLLARREPGLLRASGEMYTISGGKVSIPEVINAKNTHVDIVKNSLNELSGLSNLSFEPGSTDAGWRNRPSFRDLASFLFQPQHIIANPNVLFYKADTREHRERLRTVFPYVLGAVTPELLARRHELESLRGELRRKEGELRSAQQISTAWQAQIQARVSEARELGLLPPHGGHKLTISQAVDVLRSVVTQGPTDNAGVTENTISDAIQELTKLQQEETRIARGLEQARHRYAEMAQLRENATAYGGALQTQAERLQIARWMTTVQEEAVKCPVCENPMDAKDELNSLVNALEGIEQSAAHFTTVPASFDREFERVRGEMAAHTEKLRGLRIRIKSLSQVSDDAKARQYSQLAGARFRGMLEADLKMFERVGQEGDLSQEVENLRDAVRVLERLLGEADIRKRQENALAIIGTNAARILPDLDVERPNDPVALVIEDLTLRVKGSEREDYLSEIGSGSNWLAYHLALMLGIHEFFLRNPSHPVPSFLVIDQPSQVYFPKQLIERQPAQGETETERIFKDDDVVALQKAFLAVAGTVRRAKGKLQIVILDHAAETVWGKIPEVNSVEDWRNGNKLVPENWLA